MKTRKALLACVAAAALMAGVARADDVWLKNNATLRTDQSPAADKVVDLLKGAKVTQVQRQGNWVQVQFNGKSGWVAADSISVRPVKADTGLMGGNSSVQMSSAAAAKGLEPMSMQFAQSQGLSEAGINQMVQIKKSITPQMLKDFMADGRLGAQAQAPAAAPAR